MSVHVSSKALEEGDSQTELKNITEAAGVTPKPTLSEMADIYKLALESKGSTNSPLMVKGNNPFAA